MTLTFLSRADIIHVLLGDFAMTMLGPGLTSLNTKKRKKKFKNAEEKRQAESYEAWKKELKASLKSPEKPKRLKVDYSFVRETPHYPSREESGSAVTPRKESRVYEGERTLIGIATLHKSNMQPVFDKEYAADVAKMRRG